MYKEKRPWQAGAFSLLVSLGCEHELRPPAPLLKGTVSWNLTPMLLYIVESPFFQYCPLPLKIIFIKGPVYKLHINSSTFTAHLPLKVLDFFKGLSSACSVLWKYFIFANNFFKWRQIHGKTMISVCPAIFFQRPQHQWTKTLKEQCSYLNFLQISPCKTLSKYEAHSQIRPGTNFLHILLLKKEARQNRPSYWCEPASFKVCCMLNLILWKNPALSKTNVH